MIGGGDGDSSSCSYGNLELLYLRLTNPRGAIRLRSMHRMAILRFVLTVFFIAFSGRLVGADEPSSEKIDTYRQFALEHPGSAKSGEQLFLKEKKLACANCHRITGAEKNGPNLDGIADKYSRSELIEHILKPSLSIKPGYEQSTVITSNGRSIVGRITRAQKSMVKIVDAEGKTIDVLRPDIEEIRQSTVSMMPDNVALQISPEQFSDLIAYLETLHFAVITGFRGPDQPVKVTRIKQPVRITPLQPGDMKFANPVWCGALPGAPSQLIVLEQQEAKVWRLEPTESGMRRHLFLDLTGQVKYGANW